MSKTAEEPMLPGFETKAGWFHILKQMIENGDAKEIGANAYLVYSVIKCFSGGNDGKAFPSYETLMDRTGLARPTIAKSIKTLEEKGYISKETIPTKKGVKNVYKLREKLAITDQEGNVVAHASWDYISQAMPLALKELKNALLTGNVEGMQFVHIDRLTINLNQAFDNAHQENYTGEVKQHNYAPRSVEAEES